MEFVLEAEGGLVGVYIEGEERKQVGMVAYVWAYVMGRLVPCPSVLVAEDHEIGKVFF